MTTKISNIYYLLLFLAVLSSCTPTHTVRPIAGHPIYLEKKGEYCNLYYKNKQSKFILVADSVRTVVSVDSVFAYNRVVFSTYPDMVIVKVDKTTGRLYKKQVQGLDFQKVFPTYFSFPISTNTSYASALYDWLVGEEIVEDTEIIKQF